MKYPINNIICPLCEGTSCSIKFHMGVRDIWYCGNCKVSFAWPQPTWNELLDTYNKEYFQNAALTGSDIKGVYGYADYFTEKQLNIKRFVKILTKIEKFLPENSNRKKLHDFGCGLGSFLNLAKERSFSVSGFECNDYAVNYIKENYQFRVENEKSLTSLISSNEKYDVITMFDVIEHLHDPIGEIENAFKLLRKNGLLVISTTDFDNFLPRIMGRKFEDYRRVQEHLFFFTKKYLHKILEISGFSVLTSHSHGTTFIISNLLDRIAGKELSKSTETSSVMKLIGLSNITIPVNLGIKFVTYARR